MNYLIAVLPDRIQAEAAYTALEKEGIPKEQVTILGKGYKSADEFGLIDPKQPAKKQIRLLLTWLVPFGFLSGVAFNRLADLHTFPVGDVGNALIGGLLGAGAGAMGSFFVGGGVGSAVGSGDALPYRNRLNEGKYLVVVQAAEDVIRKATPILRSFEPENIQGYTANG